MKMCKKILSLLIAFAIIAATFVMPVSAAEKVFKYWNFDDNLVPAEVTNIPSGGVGDGRLIAKGNKAHSVKFGTVDNPIGFTIGEYPVLEMVWKYAPASGAVEDANRRQMYVNLWDKTGTLIIQFQFAQDSDGVKVSDTYALHKYEFANGIVTSTGTAKNAQEALDKEIAVLNICPFNNVTSGQGVAEFDSIKIYDPGLAATVDFTVPATVYTSDVVPFTADVKGATPEKVDFYVDGAVAGTVSSAPYTMNYTFADEKVYNNIYALATFADGSEIKSSVSSVKTMQNGRVDFDSYVPPHIQRSGATISADGEMVYNGNANAINVGTTSYSFIKGGFDLTEKRYLKMRVKLSGTPNANPYAIAFTIIAPGATQTYGSVVANEDMNGKSLSTEYQQLVFDIPEMTTDQGVKLDLAGKSVGIIQMWPMRTVTTGTFTVDWIELSDDPTVVDENPTIVALSADKEKDYAGEEVTLTADVSGTTPEKVEFYANGELFATVASAPYTAKYTLSGERNNSFAAKAVKGDKVTESNGVSVISFNELRADFDEILPPTFNVGKIDGEGNFVFEGKRSSGFNMGVPTYPIKRGGFDPTEYKYLKIRAKLEGTPYTDSYAISYTLRPVGQTSGGITCTHKTDENGKVFTDEFQELVFDITKAGIASGTPTADGIYGWLQILAMRKADPAKITIDWIELSKEASMGVSISADKKTVLSGTEVTLTSEVKGAEAEKVEFYANGKLIATDDTAPYSTTYTVTGEKLYNFTAKGIAGDKSAESGIAAVSSYTEYRMDFNEVIPPHFSRPNATLDGEGALVYTGSASATFNVGTPSMSVVNGGFDPREYRFLKIRAKLTGTAKTDSYPITINAYPEGADGTAGTYHCVYLPTSDMNGRVFTEEYQELVFDLLKMPIDGGGTFNYNGEKIGWLQLRPMRKVENGTISIDYIEISKEPVVTLTADKSGKFAEGVEVNLTATVEGTEANSVKFYDNGKLIGEDSSAPYTLLYKAMGEANHKIVAKVETATGTVSSQAVEMGTYTDMRMDFDTIIPPSFYAETAVLDGEGAVMVTGNWNTMVNVGMPSYPIKAGGFDPTDYKYMKIRAKLVGTEHADSYTMSFAMYPVGGQYGSDYGTQTYKTDENGNVFGPEYQELVFDLTKGVSPTTGEYVDLTGKTAGWIQIMPMRKVNPGTLYIDYIEFVSDKPYEIKTPEYDGAYVYTSTTLNDNMDDVADTDSVVYIVAKYNGNDLTDVKLEAVNLTEKNETEKAIDVSAMEIADGERIDVMAVKSFADMTPIMEKVTVYDDGISATDATFAGAFMDHMMLQRDMPVNVWGKSDAVDGATLEISFAGKTVSATVENGKWQAKLPALSASAEPQVLSVKSLSGTREITDVLVGDVYFVAGQSNAAFTLNGTDTWEEDREGAVAEDNIRILFSSKNAYSEEKRDTPYDKAVWQPAVNKTEAEAGWDKYGHTMINFPAIGYYMADTLRADGVDVPLGLVSIAKSGATLAAISPAHLSEGISDANKAQAYNGYVAPVENMTVKAMLWYQGESDANDRCAPTYAERFSNFVDYMRGKTGNDDMAVFMVQLSSHSDQPDGTASSWQLGKMRSIQADMVLNKTIDNLYMVASLDKGWKNGDKDIAHPMYKKPVGQRLAKVIENVFYNGENVTMPMPVSVTFDEGVCSIEFDKNLTDSTEVLGFELIKDGVAYAATIAEANGNVVDIAVENEVLCEDIADGVRYAFYSAASPLVANLQGENGLYAPTFAIDNPDADTAVKAAYVDPISRGQVE